MDVGKWSNAGAVAVARAMDKLKSIHGGWIPAIPAGMTDEFNAIASKRGAVQVREV